MIQIHRDIGVKLALMSHRIKAQRAESALTSLVLKRNLRPNGLDPEGQVPHG